MNHSPEGTGMRDALEEILRVHANDNIRPKAFYIASAALSAEPKAQAQAADSDDMLTIAYMSGVHDERARERARAQVADEQVGEVVRYKEHEMYAMQREGKLPRVPGWLVYCEGEPNVRPRVLDEFRFSMFHTPVWIPLVHQRIATPSPAAREPKAQAQAAESSSQVHGADTQAAKDAGRAASGFVKRHQAMMKAAQDVLAERERQVGAEGWTPEHDEEHDRGELCAAGAAYALAASDRLHPLSQGDGDYAADNPPLMWPHGWTFKPADPRRMLVKAAALILAEIECLDRGSCAADRADWRMRVAAIAAECTDPDAQAALDKLLEDSL